MRGLSSHRLIWSLIGLSAIVAAGFSSLAAASATTAPEVSTESVDQLEAKPDIEISRLSQSENSDRTAPTQIEVPSIDVDAPVLSVGVNAVGDFDVPGADAAGWYQFGAGPGDPGNMVIAAHVDYQGVPGVFFDLAELNEGELIRVESDGEWVEYSVTSTTNYERISLPSTDLFSRSGDHSLVLITCGGDFDHVERSYTDNVVVTATPISG